MNFNQPQPVIRIRVRPEEKDELLSLERDHEYKSNSVQIAFFNYRYHGPREHRQSREAKTKKGFVAAVRKKKMNIARGCSAISILGRKSAGVRLKDNNLAAAAGQFTSNVWAVKTISYGSVGLSERGFPQVGLLFVEKLHFLKILAGEG